MSNETKQENKQKIILTGDRPTGRLHIGHYVGSIKNRVEHQKAGDKCIILIADLHMLTTKPAKEDVALIKENAINMMLDYMASGIDPKQTIMYLQSQVHEIFELNLMLSMLVSKNRLERLPSIKEMAKTISKTVESDIADKDKSKLDDVDEKITLGLLGYPVLQSGDILLPFANIVPVGKDNLAHIELTQELAKRFNRMYGDVFPIPEAEIGNGGETLVGTDGNGKMSKSLGNTIFLSDDEQTLKKRVMGMFTDPNRTSADVPGETEKNPVFVYHRMFNPDKAEVQELTNRYQQGKVGDVEVKERLFFHLNNFLSPIREKRKALESETGYAEAMLFDGTAKMQEIARENMAKVHDVFGFKSNWNSIRRKAEKYHKKNDS